MIDAPIVALARECPWCGRPDYRAAAHAFDATVPSVWVRPGEQCPGSTVEPVPSPGRTLDGVPMRARWEVIPEEEQRWGVYDTELAEIVEWEPHPRDRYERWLAALHAGPPPKIPTVVLRHVATA